MVRRRMVLTVIVLAVLAAGPAVYGGGVAPSEPQTLRVMGGTFLKNILTGENVVNPGRNVLAEFEEEFGVTVEWVDWAHGDIAEAINRLGPLPRTEEDLIFFLGPHPSERVAPFFADLNDFLGSDPIEGFPDDFSEGILDTLTVDGKLLGMPYRSGTFALWYNEEIFEERGLPGPPKTPEELYEYAKQATFTRPNGEKVFGLVCRGTVWDLQEQLAMWARMWNGDPLSLDFKVGLDTEPIANAIEMWRNMYAEGILPSDWTTLSGSEVIQLFKDGRAAMVVEGANYNTVFNNSEDSQIRGSARVAHMPLVEELWTADRDFSASFAWFWNIGILQGSQHKDLAWDLISFTSRPEIMWQMVLNGNGPVRISLLERLVADDPGARITAEQMPFTTPALPPHDDIGEIIDIQGLAVHDIVVNGKPTDETLSVSADRIRSILSE